MGTGVPQPSTRWGGEDPLTQAPRLRTSQDDEVGMYYIHPQHPQATDTSNTYGSPNKPRKTFDNSVVYNAGDVIDVVGYVPLDAAKTIWIKGNGTNSNPIWLTGRDSPELPWLGNGVYFNGSYISVEKFDISRKGGGQVETLGFFPRSKDGSSLHHYLCKDCYGRGDNVVGRVCNSFKVEGGSGNIFHDIIFYNNDVGDYGVWNQKAENDAHAFHPAHFCEWVWVINNTVTRMGGDGIQVGSLYSDNAPRPKYTFISNNHFYQLGENAVDIKEALYTVISSNNLHGTNGDISVAGYGAVMVLHYEGCESCWVLNNKIHDGNLGIELTGGIPDSRIIGNTIYDIDRLGHETLNPSSSYVKGVGILGREHNGVIIANNTFDKNMRHLGIQNKAFRYEIYNNIFSRRNEKEEWDISGLNAESLDTCTVSHNLFHSDHGFHSRWIDRDGVNTLAAMPVFTDCVEGDPLLDVTDSSTRYQIGVGSPAIDVGKNLQTVYDEYFNIFNVDISVADQWDYTRTQGAGIDIGASEFGGVFAPALPNPVNSCFINFLTEKLEWQLGSVNETGLKVYKNNLEVADLPSGTGEHYVLDISKNVDTYRVDTYNAQGLATGATITSTVMSGVSITDDLSVTIDPIKAHVLPRQSKNESSTDMELSYPSYSSTVYGVPNSGIHYQEGSTPLGTGFTYITHEGGDILGRAVGDGSCKVSFLVTSYDGEASSRFRVGNSYFDITSQPTGDTIYTVDFRLSGSVGYSITPNTNNAKHATGILSIVEG